MTTLVYLIIINFVLIFKDSSEVLFSVKYLDLVNYWFKICLMRNRISIWKWEFWRHWGVGVHLLTFQLIFNPKILTLSANVNLQIYSIFSKTVWRISQSTKPQSNERSKCFRNQNKK